MANFISFLVIVTSPFAIVGAAILDPHLGWNGELFVGTAAVYAGAFAGLLVWNIFELLCASLDNRS